MPASYVYKWLTINTRINKNINGYIREGEVLKGVASRQLQPRYHLQHLGFLVYSHPHLMPAQTPQLLLQISRHQEEENQEGRGFMLDLRIACQM